MTSAFERTKNGTAASIYAAWTTSHNMIYFPADDARRQGFGQAAKRGAEFCRVHLAQPGHPKRELFVGCGVTG